MGGDHFAVYKTTDYGRHILVGGLQLGRLAIEQRRQATIIPALGCAGEGRGVPSKETFSMPTTDRRLELTDIPETIVEAFRETPLISFPRLAKLLGMDRKTLRDIVRTGHVPWRQKGVGKISPRRVFTLSDVAVLLDYMQRQSTQQRSRLSAREAEEIVRIAKQLVQGRRR
jgi:hypothetical protein